MNQSISYYAIPGLNVESIQSQADVNGGPIVSNLDQLLKYTIDFCNENKMALGTGYRTNIEEVKGRRKFNHIVTPRQVYCYAAKTTYPSMPLTQIGKVIGNRDHATVINSIRSIKNRIDTDNRWRAVMERFIRTLS